MSPGVLRSTLSVAGCLALLTLSACALTGGETSGTQTLLRGAGSTMAADYVEASRSTYQASRGVTLQYDAVGSGEGIRRVAMGSVDFALTDIPLTGFDLEQLKLVQVPLFYCGVVVVVNLPGVQDGELRLSDRAIGAIFAGKITRWRDPRVLRTNHGVNVPDLPIVVIHRADTSGTTFIFTSFLSGASETWAGRFGLGSRLKWPAGQAAEGSAGVRDAVRNQPGAIGYLEYGIARRGGLVTVQLQSGQGDFVRPGPASFGLALTARPAERPSHYQLLTRSLATGAWPILATEYGLIGRKERAEDRRGVGRLLHFLATSSTLADFQFLPYGAPSSGDRP
jgi:phosphate transport system substrate-binding protein